MRKFIILTLFIGTLQGCFDQSKYWDSAVLSQDIKQQQDQIDAELKLLNKIKMPKDEDNQLYIEYAKHLKIVTELEKDLRKDYKHLVKIVESQNPHTIIVNIFMLVGLLFLGIFILSLIAILTRKQKS